jgi:hypothetical protein
MDMQNNFGALPRTNNAGDNTAIGLASGFNFGAAALSNGGFDLATSGGVNGATSQMNGQSTQQGLGILGVNGVGNAGGAYHGQLGLNTQGALFPRALAVIAYAILQGLPSPQSYTDSPNVQSQTGSHGFPTPQLPFGGITGAGMPQSMFMPQQMQMFGMGAPMSGIPQSQMQMTPHVSMGPPSLPTMQQTPITPTMNKSPMYNEQQQQMAQMAQMQMQMQMMMMAGMMPNAVPPPGPTSFEPSTALEKELITALQEMDKNGRTWRQVITDFASVSVLLLTPPIHGELHTELLLRNAANHLLNGRITISNIPHASISSSVAQPPKTSRLWVSVRLLRHRIPPLLQGRSRNPS